MDDMSYKYAVINDRPVAYYQLSLKPTYSTMIQSFVDYDSLVNQIDFYNSEFPVTTHSDEINGYSTIQSGPSNTISNNIVPIVSRRNDDVSVNSCKVTNLSEITVQNNYNFFKKFYESQTIGIEFWVLLKKSSKEKITFFKSVNENDGNVTICEIYAIADMIYFSINGKVYNKTDELYSDISYTTKKQIFSWDQKLNIFASYKEKVIKLYVNSLSDEQVTMDNNFIFSYESSHPFTIGPAPTDNNFIISDLALYNRPLYSNDIQKHLDWADKDSDPSYSVKHGSGYNFNIKNQKGMFAFQKTLSLKSEYDIGFYSGLISSSTGLTIPQNVLGGEGYGSWIYEFPISNYVNYAGIDISWDTAAIQEKIANTRKVIVSASFDDGASFYKIENNKSVPFFLSTISSIDTAKLKIKVEIYSPDVSLSIQPRLDNLSIGIYNNIEILADSGGFSLLPYGNSTYMIKKSENEFLSRFKNFGISFASQDTVEYNIPDGGPTYFNLLHAVQNYEGYYVTSNSYQSNDIPVTSYGGPAGSAKISSINNTSYQSIEFWFKWNGSGSGILNVSDKNIYIDDFGILQNSLRPGDKIYLNGIDVTNTLNEIIVGDSYHILITYSSTQSDIIYLNSGDPQIGDIAPCDAIYGYIAIYPLAFSSIDVKKRYLSYVTTTNAIAHPAGNLIGTIKEYLGTENMINAGVSVVYNDSF